MRFGNLSIEKIGVVGSGNIGPDIALHWAMTLAARGVPVVVVDVAETALSRGRAKLEQKVAKGQEGGAIPSDLAGAILRCVSFTTQYGELEGASLIIEAATEDPGIKRRIFARLEQLCGRVGLLASNSFQLPPAEI